MGTLPDLRLGHPAYAARAVCRTLGAAPPGRASAFTGLAIAGALALSGRADAAQTGGEGTGDDPATRAVWIAALTAADAPHDRRRAAALALARSGSSGIAEVADLLLRVARKGAAGRAPHEHAVLAACLHGLAHSERAAAWDALAGVTQRVAGAERLPLYRVLGAAPERDLVREAFRKGLVSDDAFISCASARWLAVHGANDLRERILDLANSVSPDGGLVGLEALLLLQMAMLERFEAALYRAFVEVGARIEECASGWSLIVAARTATEDVSKRAVDDAAFVEWLLARGIALDERTEILYVLRLLAAADDARVPVHVLHLLGRFDERVDRAVLRVLASRPHPAAVEKLRWLLDSRTGASRIDVIRTLDSMRGDDPEWTAELVAMLDGAEDAVADGTLHLLAMKRGPRDAAAARRALPFVQRRTGSRSWSRRAAAYAFLENVRDPSSVPLLIGRLGKENRFRMREQVLDALHVHTGMRFPDVARWRSWWRDNQADFALIPDGHVAAIRTARIPKVERGGRTFSFYGIPIDSDRLVFAIDTSGSMAEPVRGSRTASAAGGASTSTKLDEAKRQLKPVLDGLGKGVEFNVIRFGDASQGVFPALRKLSKRSHSRAWQEVQRLRPVGGTNLFGALSDAFRDAAVDTVYLLSDGEPTVGEIVEPAAIADEVARWIVERRVRIHCVALGHDSPLLERLARESGGTYLRVR